MRWRPCQADVPFFRVNGCDAADYRDRDYERQLYGFFLEGDW